ncbi:MAG: hypothetical protein M1819_006736 [Sarea resinae]|nr:MAG: hypothetical protein M1819_006736 [Sarea resinae]
MASPSPPLGPPPFELNDADREVLAQTDDQFHLHTWGDLKQIIADNDLGILKRKPSDLVRYIQWSQETQAAYGTISNFICLRRLCWQPRQPLGSGREPVFDFNDLTPFADPDDYKILRNDWPYGFTPDITHLVVWLKVPIPTDPLTGDLTPASKAILEKFIQRTFVDDLARRGLTEDRVQWFKNWAALQSVRGLEHMHVLVRDVPAEVITEWTGDESLQQTVDGNATVGDGAVPSARNLR